MNVSLVDNTGEPGVVIVSIVMWVAGRNLLVLILDMLYHLRYG